MSILETTHDRFERQQQHKERKARMKSTKRRLLVATDRFQNMRLASLHEIRKALGVSGMYSKKGVKGSKPISKLPRAELAECLCRVVRRNLDFYCQEDHSGMFPRTRGERVISICGELEGF